MSAKFTLEGDAGGAVKALDAVNKALDATKKGAEGAVVSTKALQAIAMRIREAEDPQQKYNRKLAEMKSALDAGLISQKQFESGSKKLAEQLEKAGKAGDKAFGAGALQNIGQMAMSITGITSALDLAVDAMRNYREEQKKAADDAMRARAGVGQLSQLAASAKNPGQAFKDLASEADSYLRMGAAGDRNEAASLTFDLAAAGLEVKDRAFAAKMRSTGTLTNVGGLAQSYDALKTAMGAKEVGSFEQFASKALAAGATAPGTVEQLPVALARAGTNAKTLGITDEFLLAAGAVLAKEAGSPSEGGTKLNAFLAGIQKSGVDTSGMSGVQMIERFGKENTDFGGVFKDNNEAISAYRTLRANMVAVADLEGNISGAQNQGLAMKAIGLPNLDPSQFAANLRAEAEGGLAFINDQTLSRGENLRQAAMADWARTRRRDAPGIWTEWDLAMERAATHVPILGNADTHLQAAATAAPGGPGAIENQALLAEIRDYLKDIKESNNGIQRTQHSRLSTRQE